MTLPARLRTAASCATDAAQPDHFGAHTANMAEDGLPGERHIGYYRERALGGAGMIVVEPVPVHRTAVLTRGNFRHDDDSIIPAFRRLTDACREAGPGVVMIQQLYHVGQHGDADNSFAPNWSPSGLPSYHDADGSHAMTVAEIEEVDRRLHRGRRARARRAASTASRSSPRTTRSSTSSGRRGRTGGPTSGAATPEDRMRFSSTDPARASARRCGDDFIVGLAVNVDPESDGVAVARARLADIVAWHDERRLMDYVTCGTGSYFDFYQVMPTSLYAAAPRRAVRGAR